jgi:hypothetical protein
MAHSATLPFALAEHPVSADNPALAPLLGQKWAWTHPDLGPIEVRLFKTAGALTDPKNKAVKWSDDDNHTVVYTTEVTDRAVGVIPPDLIADVASGDYVLAIVKGRVDLRNEDAATIAAGNFVIPAATDGLVNDGDATITPGLDFARMLEAFTGNGQTKSAELLHELVG